MTPKRVQRSRAKGWRMPPNTVYVGRPTRFGNPYRTAGEFQGWLNDHFRRSDGKPALAARRARLLDSVRELRGKNLACWCPLDQPCHADVLLELANR